MRKIKKINGYLVVKFNDCELRKWADTGLGNFGVIDAELYTGCLEVDRSVMEYDSAGSIEEAVEQARGLESELEVDEPATTYTIVKETDETMEETEVDPVLMVDEWEEALTYQIESERYPGVNPETARHELYGFKTALHQLGLLDFEDCFVEPKTFKPMTGKALNNEAALRGVLKLQKEIEDYTNSGPIPLSPEAVPIKINYPATMDYLKRQRDMATHNLFCYSANYAMTKPKEGYEEEWRKAGRDCEIVEELLRIIPPGKEGDDLNDRD